MKELSPAQQMHWVFRGSPTRHIRLNNVVVTQDGSLPTKAVQTLHCQASRASFEAHVAPEAQDGPGGIGLHPGFTWQDRNGLWTDWAMLDFDADSPVDLQPFIAILARQGLKVWFNNGTRGRGAHLWFLLSLPIPLASAAASVDFLRRAAVKWGVEPGKVECRPQNAQGGAAVFLPYRGAALDGEGFNPLIDAASGEVIALSHLATLERQDAQRFQSLGLLRSLRRFLSGTYRPKPVLAPRLDSHLQSTDKTDRWTTELERLPALWEEGRRHHLTMGAACHGLNCGIEPGQIEADLMHLVSLCGDEEADLRRRAIREVIRRSRQGRPTSATHFYREAGVEAPCKVSDETRDILKDLWVRMLHDPWRGTVGKSSRSIYKALLNLASHHGHRHPEGVEVSVSWAALQEEADVGSSSTLRNALAFLEQQGLTRRGAASEGEKSGSLILLVTERSTLITERGLRECFGSSPYFRNGDGKLGKTAEQVFDLLTCFGPQTLKQVAERMATRPTDLRAHRDNLLEAGLIEEDDHHVLSVQANALQALQVRQKEDGTQHSRERQQEHTRLRRQRFHAYRKARAQGDSD